MRSWASKSGSTAHGSPPSLRGANCPTPRVLTAVRSTRRGRWTCRPRSRTRRCAAGGPWGAVPARAHSGRARAPGLAVFRSLSHTLTTGIADTAGRTLAAAASLGPELKGGRQTKVDEAKVVGRLVAERARTAGVAQVVFDRAGYRYHGRVKTLADAAREAGLDF